MKELKNIFSALDALENRRPQLEGLHVSIQLYADGTGFVFDGLGKELAVIHQPLTQGEIVELINKIPRE